MKEMGGSNPEKKKPKPSSSSQHHHQHQHHNHHQQRKSHPEPSPSKPPSNFKSNPIPPPPSYGFHMLDRRTIVLADGTARSYLALPPDYQNFPPIRPEPWLGFDPQGFWGSRKRKFVGDDEFARQRQQLLQYGSGAGPSHIRNLHSEIDQSKMKTSFFNFIRLINENANQKKKYLADGKQGSLQCLACVRSSKDFPDVHSLIMHTYNPEKSTPDQVPDHLGLHKALCILMGWNYMMPPDNLKSYQQLSAEEIAADRDDLIMWPPHVIIRNTGTGKGKDGRMEGLGNKAMDMKLRDFGITTGKPKSMYSRDGHMATTVVKFAGDQSGLKDAMRLADLFEKQKHGRRSWTSVQLMLRPGNDDENDPNFVKMDKKTGEKERVLYGYLGTVFDLEILDFDTRRKVTIESKSEKAHHT